ncbi:sulfotransferase 1 family member D1-like isoform X1 [Limulus polyphemus]|uniref:Sulfotransferase 1 family member D1-like isoform X1 n=2 Tax=Limulus polyphemus TaxID=6850 RepID=A0ABM1BUM9_LIMPO|nr:sulfotransferase 1 family member D1-like isoform X1 [Limulus polyphemus]
MYKCMRKRRSRQNTNTKSFDLKMGGKNTKTFKIQDDSKNTHKKIPLHTVEGIPIPTSFFTPEKLQSAISYKATPEDVFIVTYPKCGTTWMQYIVWEIINEGAPLPSFDDMNVKYVPFLELTGREIAETMKPPKLFKVHLPYHLTPHHPEAKYIFVARNPFDCCVSFYNHTKKIKNCYHFEDGTFDDFFECFIRGEVHYGDFFDHLLSWWPHRQDPNVLFTTYEEMKSNPENAVTNVAKFLGNDYWEKLKDDKDLVDKILENTDFNNMKEKLQYNIGQDGDNDQKVEFFRKGQVGEWKENFSDEQYRRLKKHMMQKTEGTDIPKLWKDL